MTGTHEETKGRSAVEAAETVATLVPNVKGSLVFEEREMSGPGAPSIIFTPEPTKARCCARMVFILINRYGRTRCLPCDADATEARALRHSELAVTK
jgi:hypothetical protein